MPASDSPSILQRFQVVVSEIQRIHNSPTKFFQAVNSGEEPGFHSLYVPGTGVVPMSEKAQQQFQALARVAAKQLGPDKAKTDIDSVISEIKSIFGELLATHIDLSDLNANQAIQETVVRVKALHVERTHFIPASVVVPRIPEDFWLGPVHFETRERFESRYRNAIEAKVESSGSATSAENIWDFFSTCTWVASVLVPPCDCQTSKVKARATVQKALDALKLLIWPHKGSRIRSAYERRDPSRSSEVCLACGGGFEICFADKLEDAVAVEGWYETLSPGLYWKTISSLIRDAHESWGPLPDPKQRFLDSLGWYGDAVTETDMQARILKFWTCLERLVSLSISAGIERRIAVLETRDLSKVPHICMEIEKLHNYRSNIIHGSAARDGYDSRKAHAAEVHASRALKGYLRLLDSLKDSDITKQDVTRELDELDKRWRTEARSLANI